MLLTKLFLPLISQNMKNLKYKLSAVLLSFLLWGCDLNTEPTTSVGQGNVYNNLQNVEYVINGTWSYVWETYNTYAAPGWSTLMLLSDYMGSDVVETGKYGYSDVYRYSATSLGNNVHISLVWRLAYKTIDNMNNILSQIDNVPGDDSYRERIKAQAYAFRGYMYLNLATYYAHAYSMNPDQPCVPIYTEPTTPETQGNPRSTLSQVYARAEEDLLNAFNSLEGYTRPARYKIDRNVSAGLLARLYLQTENWEEAQRFASLAHQGYEWMTQAEYLNGFNDLSNAEWIWGQGTTTDQNVASDSFGFKDVLSRNAGYYSMMADPYFMDLFDSNDIRYQLFEWKTDPSRSPGYLMYKKFRYKDNSTADIVIIRKAEMVLIEAEALAEQDLLTDAIDRLDELRSARGADRPNLSSLSKEDLVEEILIERRKELFGEGFALADIKRRQKAVQRKVFTEGEVIPGTDFIKRGHTILRFPNGTEFVPNSPYYILSIPATEITNNPNLD